MSKTLGLLAAIGLMAAGSLSAAAAGTGAGKALFASHCAICHKASGEGGLKLGKAVSADLRSPGLEATYHNSDALILRAILEGKDEDGGPLQAPMPHWKGSLTKAQARQILAYIKTLCCHTDKESKGDD